jgi:hypothetical protein
MQFPIFETPLKPNSFSQNLMQPKLPVTQLPLLLLPTQDQQPMFTRSSHQWSTTPILSSFKVM